MATEIKAWWVKEAEKRIMAMRNIKLAVIFVGLNIIDAALTVAGMNRGRVCELNPIMSHLLEQPEWVFWATKISLALVFALVLLAFSNKYPRPIHRIFLILVGVMVGICLINLVSLIGG